MAIKYLKSDQLPAFLGWLAESRRVVAPVKANGVVQYQPWTPGDEVELDVLLAKQSPKEFVFPQCETYLTFEYQTVLPEEAADEGEGSREPALPSESISVEPRNEAPAQVIFGLRSCDARGLVQMDRVFGGYGGFYYDPLYNARREATTLLAVTCAKPRSTCFCTTVGGCPAAQEGADALFTPVEGGFAVEAFSEKGEAAAAYPGMVEATEAQAAEMNEVKLRASSEVDATFSLEGLRDALEANIDDPRWSELSMRCLSCGTCTYVCPTCYCFSVNDELVETRGERYRVLDNCFNPLYTEETSGHNARAQKAKRFRNRFSHKFWYYPDKYDSLLCTGCGRCITNCPVRIDIREVVQVMGGGDETAAATAAASTGGKEA